MTTPTDPTALPLPAALSTASSAEAEIKGASELGSLAAALDTPSSPAQPPAPLAPDPLGPHERLDRARMRQREAWHVYVASTGGPLAPWPLAYLVSGDGLACATVAPLTRAERRADLTLPPLLRVQRALYGDATRAAQLEPLARARVYRHRVVVLLLAPWEQAALRPPGEPFAGARFRMGAQLLRAPDALGETERLLLQRAATQRPRLARRLRLLLGVVSGMVGLIAMLGWVRRVVKRRRALQRAQQTQRPEVELADKERRLRF